MSHLRMQSKTKVPSATPRLAAGFPAGETAAHNEKRANDQMRTGRKLWLSLVLVLAPGPVLACPVGHVCLTAVSVPLGAPAVGVCPGMGDVATVSVTIPAAAVPIATTPTSAIYKVPVGGIGVSIAGIGIIHNTIVGKLIYLIGAHHDSINIGGAGPMDTLIKFVAEALPLGTFPATVLGAGGHPSDVVLPPGGPVPLNGLPHNYLQYAYDPATNSICGNTKFGFTGSLF